MPRLWKQRVAAGWSLLPGAGQVYVGQKGSGAVRFAIALTAAAAVLVPVVAGFERRADLTWGHDWPLLVLGVGGLVVLSIDYTRSYEDAERAVVEWNEQLEAAFEDAHPDAP